ncbi:unnamed protein product, partial [Ectocarpus sp. 12 AP-2014]
LNLPTGVARDATRDARSPGSTLNPRKVYLALCIQLVYAGLACLTMRGNR